MYGPEAVLGVANERQPGWTTGSGVTGVVVLREHAAHDIFVDVNAEGMRDLLGDADAAEFGISALELDDRRDEFRGRTVGAGFAAMHGGGKGQAVFPIHQGLVELEQCCRLDERAKLRNPARAHEQRAQTKHRAIERGQIRRTLPGSITDQELMFEQMRFCSDGTYTPGRSSLANVTSRWMARIRSSRMGRTVP